ncbi:MAG: hypothetical protein Q4A31_12045 [Corynebacterium sp.]|uniref:hypothetical protein n=1 Tax=Corynebacterium sp. TaxID=1720 RepID=UPI0026DC9795|nr:hypothetical protein [Corynebacterium sp.]MDO4762645.1 hypothetical protein [Corynebacterium sp.]
MYCGAEGSRYCENVRVLGTGTVYRCGVFPCVLPEKLNITFVIALVIMALAPWLMVRDSIGLQHAHNHAVFSDREHWAAGHEDHQRDSL